MEIFIKNKKVFIDDDDYEIIKKYNWWFKDGKYAICEIEGKRFYMHQLILNSRNLIDHMDRNTLNNKKENLRFVNKSQNSMNSKKRIDNSSGIKGVSWDKGKLMWHVYLNINKKRKFLGYFKDLGSAALVRARNEEIYFGQFANQELIKQIKEKYG